MLITAISDTHTKLKEVKINPATDMLIHAGDLLSMGKEKEAKRELAYLESLDIKYKLYTPGNHDHYWDPNAPKRFRDWSLYRHYTTQEMMAKFPSVTLLLDQEITIEGFKIYGSPWTPYLPQPDDIPWAFNFKPIWKGGYEDADSHWSQIPSDTNILITHGPPQGILDTGHHGDDRHGCPILRRHLNRLTDLKLHVFGHIHSSYGKEEYRADDGSKLTFVNAAIMDSDYNPVHKPIEVTL